MPALKRILGIDPGEKRIGVAISDPLAITAQGLPTILSKSSSEAVLEICKITREYKVEKIVIGLPLNMDGTEGEQAKLAYQLGAQLEDLLDVPIIFRDERLTSRQAEAVLLDADVRREKRKEHIDKLSAQIILQSYLDEQEERKA